MNVPRIEWVDGDPFWPRIQRVMRWVALGILVLAFLTLFQGLGIVSILPYSTLGLTGLLIELGLIGLLLLVVLLPFRFPVAGPIGITTAGLVVRGGVRPRLIPRGRIAWVSPQRAFITGWGGAELVLTPTQAEKIARWFYSP